MGTSLHGFNERGELVVGSPEQVTENNLFEQEVLGYQDCKGNGDAQSPDS